jgi:phosphoribosylaminoimidazole-succinocarboxamide synthase
VSLVDGPLAGLADRHLHSGKVRELFAVGDDLLMVSSDRMSAFDYDLATDIPDKGAILTALSLWWFEQLADVVPHHVITARVEDYPADLAPYAEALRGRSVLCRRLDMVGVECVARGYLAGSGYAEYTRTGTICGIALPAGLEDGSRLPEPIFTPTTKAPIGEHDEPMTYAEVVDQVGVQTAAALREVTLAVFERGRAIAERSGILLADTKVELGYDGNGVLAAGQVAAGYALDPNHVQATAEHRSPAQTWHPGGAQPSYDKQYVRDWLSTESGWDRASGAAPPPLPDEVVERTRAKYVEAYERLTGRDFASYLRSA